MSATGFVRRRSTNRVIRLALLALIVVYLLSMSPGYTWRHGGVDGGELAVVSQRLGIAHPPGYMLYTLLGWLSMQMHGTFPYDQLRFLSIVYALIACVLAGSAAHYAGTTSGGRSAAGGFAALLALAFSHTFWSQAIIVEVYMLMTLLFCVLLSFALHWHARAPSRWSLLIGGHVLGLAITHHLTTLLWLPGLLLLTWRLSWRARGLVGVGMVTGFWTWGLMLLRAGREPLANWGGIESGLDAFWAHITGQIYNDLLLAPSVERFADGVLAWLARLPAEFTPLGAVLLVGGVIAAMRNGQRALLGASGLWVVLVAGFTGLYTADNTRLAYTLPLSVIGAVYIGLGVDGMMRALPRQRGLWATPLLLAALLLALNWYAVSIRGDRAPLRFAQDVIASVPPGSVVIVETDEETFTLWYYQTVEGMGRDLMIVNANLLRFAWYRESLARLHPELTPLGDSVNEWIRSDALAAYPVALLDFMPPPPGRRAQRSGEWTILTPVDEISAQTGEQ